MDSESVPVIVQVILKNTQQCICKLLQGGFIVLDLPQVVEQGLGGELHLQGSSRHVICAFMSVSSFPSTQTGPTLHRLPGEIVYDAVFVVLMVSSPEVGL